MKVLLKRLLLLLVVVAMLLPTLAACGKDDSDEKNCDNGHNYENGVCTVCGEAEPEPEDPCKDGHTFVGGTCTVCGETEPEPENPCKDGHAYQNGKCTVCGAADPDFKPEFIDYASQVKFDKNSGRKYAEVEVKSFIDGDTTHFIPIDGTVIGEMEYVKARYLAINTPESTGIIEPWGKKASNYTKTQLSKAVSIIIESDDDKWNLDSTGGRYLLWVWYKTAEDTEYRNLNLEILCQGLAFGSNVLSNVYGEVALNALNQAKSLKLHVFDRSTKDPDFYYGDAVELSLKEIKANCEKYESMTVKFDAVVAKQVGPTIYVEEYDAENDMYFGMQIFAGYSFPRMEMFAIGNRITVVGTLQYYENGGTYQVSNLKYKTIDPNWEGGCRVIGTGFSSSYNEITADELMNGKIVLDTYKEVGDGEEKEEILVEETFDYGELAHYSTVTMKNLTVKSVYTTTSDTDSNGALTITCTSPEGITIKVRTASKLVKIVDGNEVDVVASDFPAGTVISVRGVIDSFNGEYQIKVFNINDVTYG